MTSQSLWHGFKYYLNRLYCNKDIKFVNNNLIR